jgi:hypothetical protein
MVVLAFWSVQLSQAIQVVNCFEKKKFKNEEGAPTNSVRIAYL